MSHPADANHFSPIPLISTSKLKPTDLFETLQKITLDSGAAAAAQLLVNEMRSQERYPELFEALKMLHRIELGLPAVHTDLSGAHSTEHA